MKPRYSFESMYDGRYQVRLKGEFVTYTTEKDSKAVDEFLRINGFDTREDFLRFCYRENVAFLTGAK